MTRFRFAPLAAAALAASCAQKPLPPVTVYALGTVCSLNAYEAGTEELYGALAARLRAIEETFSVRIATSDVARVNLSAGDAPVPVSAETVFVVSRALYFAEKSGGAFNPAIGALSTAWDIGSDGARALSDEEIAALLPLTDWRKVDADAEAGTVFLRERGMVLDLGGIAKGYAADELAAMLRARGVERAVLNLGGNVYVLGEKAAGAPWSVGVRDPAEPRGDAALSLALSDTSAVTSGMYERFFTEDGERYHHILDPATGRPAASGVLSATVVCRSSLAADALSTAVFVLGREKGLALLSEDFAEVDAEPEGVVIDAAGEVGATAGLAASLAVRKAPYRLAAE